MKISGKFILKVAGTLTVISLITAFLLGLVNGVTKDKIAAIDAEKTRVAMSAVVPEGSEFTDALDLTDDVVAAAKAQGGTITELYGVTNGGAEAGYVAKVSASGSQGTITMMVASTPTRPSPASLWSATPRPPASAPRWLRTSPTPPVPPSWISLSACPAPALWWWAATSPPSPVPPFPPRASPWAPTPPWLPWKLWAKKGGAAI